MTRNFGIFPDVTFVKHLTGDVYNQIEQEEGFLLHFKLFSHFLAHVLAHQFLWQINIVTRSRNNPFERDSIKFSPFSLCGFSF